MDHGPGGLGIDGPVIDGAVVVDDHVATETTFRWFDDMPRRVTKA